MFRKMKGQSATEYLMTYGWAILAITIVGALLYTQVFSQRSCGEPGATGFPLVSAATVDNNEFSIDGATGHIQLAVKNNVGKDITVTQLVRDGTTVEIPDVLITDGQTGVVQSSGTDVFVAAGQAAGDCYSYDVTMIYNTSTGIPSRASGTLNGKF